MTESLAATYCFGIVMSLLICSLLDIESPKKAFLASVFWLPVLIVLAFMSIMNERSKQEIREKYNNDWYDM